MAFYSISDPELWGRGMERMAAIGKQGGTDGLAMANFVLGNPEDNAPVATVLRMKPGYVLPRHGHSCHRFEVVVQGSIKVGDKVLGPGSLMFSEPGNLYGPHIAGPEGCTTVEIFGTYKSSHNTLIDGPAGIEECDIADAGGAKRMMELVRLQFAQSAI
jgi:hypothetical protein